MASTYPSPASFNTPIVGNVGTVSVAIVPQNLARDALYMFNPGPATIWLCPSVGTDQLPLAASVGGVGSIPVPAGNTFFAEGFTGAINAIADSGSGNVLTVWECYQHSRFEVEEMANAIQFSITPGQIPGVTNGSDALPGNVGEIISSAVPVGSALSLTNNVAANLTSMILSAGDWDVFFAPTYQATATTSIVQFLSSISLVSGTLDLGTGNLDTWNFAVAGVTPGLTNTIFTFLAGPRRISSTTSTTVFGVVQAGFGVSTMSAFGILRARRMR